MLLLNEFIYCDHSSCALIEYRKIYVKIIEMGKWKK